MGTRLRLTLLMLAALPDAMPPYRPPGHHLNVSPVPTVPCEERNCGEGTWQNGKVYKCDMCGTYFNYCSFDKKYFKDSEAAKHLDTPG